jgi:hypothetical protein
MKFFFWSAYAKKIYGLKYSDFQDLVDPFRFWTFINVQKPFPISLLGFKNLRYYIY